MEITLSSHIETDDDTEHVLSSTGEMGLQPYARVETLTDNPVASDETNAEGENLPVRAEISSCGGSAIVFNHVAKHVFGRLIGYEIWSDPVDVMTPKNLFGISWEYGDNVQFALDGLTFVFNNDMENITNHIPRQLNGLADADPEFIPRKIEDVKHFTLEKRDDIEQYVNQNFIGRIEQAMEKTRAT